MQSCGVALGTPEAIAFKAAAFNTFPRSLGIKESRKGLGVARGESSVIKLGLSTSVLIIAPGVLVGKRGRPVAVVRLRGSTLGARFIAPTTLRVVPLVPAKGPALGTVASVRPQRAACQAVPSPRDQTDLVPLVTCSFTKKAAKITLREISSPLQALSARPRGTPPTALLKGRRFNGAKSGLDS